MRSHFTDKTVLITGAAGTVGKELVRQLIQYHPRELRLLENNESELFLLNDKYRDSGMVRAYLGDIRDSNKMVKITKGVDIIFHVAAFKHVCISEYNPFDAVQTNINGVKNLIEAALSNNVSRVIFTSSDKAVNPTNVMGTTKLMGERIVTAANIVNNNGHQVFSSVRFGNILGSRGSVVPIFAGQIMRGEDVTITDPRMTRFIMTVQQAAKMVLESAILACGGEVFVTKMPTIRISDLARAMVELMAPLIGRNPDEINIKCIGVRAGEKIYEELMSHEEVGRTRELSTMFAILPALRAFYRNIEYCYPDTVAVQENLDPYTSLTQAAMTLEELKSYLECNQILDEFVPGKRFQAESPAVVMNKIAPLSWDTATVNQRRL